MDLERTMTLYEESDAHSMKSGCSTVDTSQINDLEQPSIDCSWLSAPAQVVYPNVPSVVEAKEAEDDDEEDSRSLNRRRDHVPVTSSAAAARQTFHRLPYGGPVTTSNGGGGVRFFQQPAFIPVSVCSPNDEPQTVPCVAAPVSSGKLERKRERNRVAAQKCRQRKVEQISILQERAQTLNQTRVDLERTIEELRHQINLLRQHLHQHVSAGCQLSHRKQLHTVVG